MPWREWACGLSLAYGWTPNQIAELTVAQAWTYLAGAVGPGTRRRMSREEAAAWLGARCEHKQQWIRRMMESTAHGK